MTYKRITLGILAHVDAGKTTLSEAMLYRTGELRKPGRVDHGDTFLDDTEIERNRGITVFSRQARLTIPGSRCQAPGGIETFDSAGSPARKTGGSASRRPCDSDAFDPAGSQARKTSGSASRKPGDSDASGKTETSDAGQDTQVTLIDTPGHVDFAAEMERALSVLDYALLVVSGSEGVQAHTRTLYRMLSERGIPVFVFINKMDIAVRSKTDILAELAAELDCGAVDFTGITGSSAISAQPGSCESNGTGYRSSNSNSTGYRNSNNSTGYRNSSSTGYLNDNSNLNSNSSAGSNRISDVRMITAEAAEEFIDAVTLYSSELAELVLEHELETGGESNNDNDAARGAGAGERVDNEAAGDRLVNADNRKPDQSVKKSNNADAMTWIPDDYEIAMAVRRGEIVPCIFGSALKIEGVDEMLEVIGRFTIEPGYGSDFGAKVYKVANAEDGSRMTFIKVTGGTLHVRDLVTARHSVPAGSRNADMLSDSGSGVSDEMLTMIPGMDMSPDSGARHAEYETGERCKINQIRLYSGSKYVTADEAPAGTVCAVTGLTYVLPGDALGNEMPEDEAVIRPFTIYTVECPEERDPYLVMKDLEKLAQEDPALSIRWLRETGEIEMRLMGQVQLEVITTLVRDRFGYDISFGSGKIMYLETISGVFEGIGHFEPLRHYAEVHVIAEPGERGSGVVIRSIVPEDELARNWQRLILTHIDEKEHAGVLTGSPLTDVRLTLSAGRAHDKHTNGGDFREATYRAIRNALMQAREAGQAVLLEPWYEYEIELPSQMVGRAMTDIRQMGGSQDGLEQNGETSRIRGKVPASEIAGYQQTLTSYTAGLGRLSCTHAGYFACHNTEEVIEECGYDPERDIDNPADSVFVNHGGSDIVKWDEVPQHMHLGSTLQRYLRQAGYIGSGSEYGDGQDGVHGYGGRVYTGFGDRTDYAIGSNGAGSGSGAGRGIHGQAGGQIYGPDGRTGGQIYGPDGLTGGESNAGFLSAEERKRQLAAEKELQQIFERTYGQARNRTGKEAIERRYNGDNEKSPEQQAADELRNQQIRARHERKKKGNTAEESTVILIDGYNLIHADEYLRELSVRDMGAARDQILERLCNYAAYTGSEIVIVFDAYKVSGGEGHEEDYLGVRVVFTAQDEPADIRIGLLTNSLKGCRMYVVSSDMLVQQDSFEHGALRISSREFMRLLDQTEEEIRRALVES